MSRLRSVNNTVIAPARTGRDNNSSSAVIAIDHTNSGVRSEYPKTALKPTLRSNQSVPESVSKHFG